MKSIIDTRFNITFEGVDMRGVIIDSRCWLCIEDVANVLKIRRYKRTLLAMPKCMKLYVYDSDVDQEGYGSWYIKPTGIYHLVKQVKDMDRLIALMNWLSIVAIPDFFDKQSMDDASILHTNLWEANHEAFSLLKEAIAMYECDPKQTTKWRKRVMTAAELLQHSLFGLAYRLGYMGIMDQDEHNDQQKIGRLFNQLRDHSEH